MLGIYTDLRISIYTDIRLDSPQRQEGQEEDIVRRGKKQTKNSKIRVGIKNRLLVTTSHSLKKCHRPK